MVNNAGLVRDRMLVNMSEEEWDTVLRVDLKGHFVPLRHAAAYWRDQHKAGTPAKARVVNTSSGAGLLGSVGQGNYQAYAAKTHATWDKTTIAHNTISIDGKRPMTIRCACSAPFGGPVVPEV